jgi:hypothetical protein
MIPPIPGHDPVMPEPDSETRALMALQDLHNQTLDVLAGYETMLDRAEAGFRPVVQRFVDLHRRHADVLARILSEEARAEPGDGTLMGTVNRMVVATRALVDTIDEGRMNAIRRGEAHVMDAFKAARACPLDAGTDLRLQTMARELADLLADTRDIARDIG